MCFLKLNPRARVLQKALGQACTANHVIGSRRFAMRCKNEHRVVTTLHWRSQNLDQRKEKVDSPFLCEHNS